MSEEITTVNPVDSLYQQVLGEYEESSKLWEEYLQNCLARFFLVYRGALKNAAREGRRPYLDITWGSCADSSNQMVEMASELYRVMLRACNREEITYKGFSIKVSAENKALDQHSYLIRIGWGPR